MPFPKGFKHSEETRAKMSAAHKGIPHDDQRKQKISEANKGKKRTPRYEQTCPCGVVFMATQPHAVWHSSKCKRVFNGRSIVHNADYQQYPRMCAICSKTDDLVGDHDHATGKPRGILCRNCNLAIGNMFDSPERLRAAAHYLEGTI